MPATVLLKDIADALEMQFDDSASYLNLDTGEIETVSNTLLSAAEESPDQESPDDMPDLLDWELENWEVAKRIVSSDRYLSLPTKFDVHEWAILKEFAESVQSKTIREDLLHAIHGPGAFRHFKHNLQRHGIESDWYDFRSEALRKIAREWCEENQIPWR